MDIMQKFPKKIAKRSGGIILIITHSDLHMRGINAPLPQFIYLVKLIHNQEFYYHVLKVFELEKTIADTTNK